MVKEHDWQYTNVKLPENTALMIGANSVDELVKALTGRKHKLLWDAFYPSTGSSPFGPYEEGDIAFFDEGTRYLLSYDFMLLDNGIARVFRTCLKED